MQTATSAARTVEQVSAGPATRAGVVLRATAAARSGLSAVRRAKVLLTLWALTRETVAICLRYRVTGLASEAGFFALLSLPPLILGLVGGVGYVGAAVGSDAVSDVRLQIQRYANQVFASESIVNTIMVSIDDVLERGRLDIISIAFLISLWSGSRVLNVFIDTISIMYGQGGERGIVRTRALSFSLYIVGLLVGAVILPLVLLGPSLLDDLLPAGWQFVLSLYWPVVTLLTVASLASLYHVSTPRRSPWTRDIPGGILALVIWVLASFALRKVIAVSVGGTSIYGPLAASIVVLIWLYFLAIAVLIGAALNAATRQMWPSAVQRYHPLARLRVKPDGVPLTPMPVVDDQVAGAALDRPGEVRPAEVRPAEVRPAEVRPAEVRPENQVTEPVKQA
jgi:membrane protein